VDDSPALTAADELGAGRGDGGMAVEKEDSSGEGGTSSEVDCPSTGDAIGDSPIEDNEDEVVPPKSNMSVDFGGT